MLTIDELQGMLQELGENPIELNFAEAEAAVAILDPTGNGYVRYESLCAWYMS